MRQESTANILHLPLRPWDASKKPQDSRQGTGQVCSQRGCCLGPRKRMKCFLATLRGHQRAKKPGNNSLQLSLLLPTQLPKSLPPYRLLFSGHKQSDSLFSPPDPYTKLLPGGCCSRNDVQAFDSAPDHWLKGCHFSFRSLSIPRQLFISKPQRHTFYHSHTRHVTSPIMPSHQLSYQGTRFFCKHKYLNSKTIVINKILQIIITLIILELIRCWCVLFSPCRP